MASSSSLFNSFSFLLPSQKNPLQIISITPSYCDPLLPRLSSSSSSSSSTATTCVSFQNRRNRYGFVPITSIQKSATQNDDPSLPSSNTLYCRARACHVEMVVEEDESIDSLIYRFKRAVLRSRVIQDARRRRFHETSQEERKRKSRDAARRNRRRRFLMRGGQIEDQEASKEEKEEEEKAMDDDDNWEYFDWK